MILTFLLTFFRNSAKSAMALCWRIQQDAGVFIHVHLQINTQTFPFLTYQNIYLDFHIYFNRQI